MFIEAELTDPLNEIEKVQYMLNGRLIGTDLLPRKTEHWIGGQHFKLGNNDFQAVAIHFNGQITQSQSINIEVY